MTGAELLKKKDHAIGVFKKHFSYLPTELIEDFGSFCMEKWVNKTYLRTSYHHMAIDFLRYNALKTSKRGSQDLMSSPLRTQDPEDYIIAENNSEESKDIERFELTDFLKNDSIKVEERVILVLYFEWGFTQAEIGKVLGLHETRIFQKFNEIIRRYKYLFKIRALQE